VSRTRAVVLAAGKGTRMKSARAKVLHELCGRPMVWFVIRALRDAGIDEVVVVSNADVAERLPVIVADAGHAAVDVAIQEPQLGTGHAVQVALAKLAARAGGLLVVNGDLPLIDARLIGRAIEARSGALALVTAKVPLPSALGRIVRRGERIAKIVEARDANDEQLAIDEVNAGLYVYDETKLRNVVAELANVNAQGEYYLTDTIDLLVRDGERVVPVLADDFLSVLGVNDRSELATAATLLNRRICEHHMCNGVTIVDPTTTYLEPDLEIAADVTIQPNTAIGRRSKVGAHSEIGPNSRLSAAEIGEHVVITDSIIVDSTLGDFVRVGPWAHVRGGSVIDTGVTLGDYVEVKASHLGAGVNARHLAYLGDATVGERANIGAGTITCNYDGKEKHRTKIGKDAFIGTNTSLVAPLEIGDGALTGAGSVVIRDVPPGGRVAGNPARPLSEKAE
jgi:bifunctional UDP-N-acetylglucosamine pyrophosphorylase/glucosamine-1-phosphate N-acetyltransferase